MISSNCSLIVVAAMICVSAAKAREVDLVHFSPFAATANNEQGAVGVALSTHFEGLVEPADARRVSERTHAFGGIEPSGLFEPKHSAIMAPSTSSSCLQNGYRPTWWLSPEVENRRVAYFAAMSAIACENGLPESLLDAVIAQESGYKAWALSGAGAMGMMQVMPGTARNLELWNPWDALANMRAGARYLRQQLDRFRRVDLALAAYNAGPERRSLALGSIPAIPETRNYVQAITTNWVRLTKLGSPNSIVAARAMAANLAVQASGYREVSLITYVGTNAANPI
ncbi:Transglycosylase SLT domain-containing protein [Novosphingobium sp. B1]|nr:Transglycosylase SLT domain-containing protein [Novosphingobium sp. B1]